MVLVPGYRSPLRSVPDEVIPDSTFFFNPMGNNELQEHITVYNDETIEDSCKKDGWWLEAIRVADKVEKKALDFRVSPITQLAAA